MRKLLLLALLCSGLAPGAAANDRWWFGGGLGLAFGTVDWIEVAPVVGHRATDRLDLGGSILYRYRDDDRFEPSLSTSDYGASLFARYYITPGLFGHAEYEVLSYEFVDFALKEDRDEYDSLLVGPGVSQPIGQRARFFAMALYNFSYDDDELFAPYDDAWVYRVGVGFGF